MKTFLSAALWSNRIRANTLLVLACLTFSHASNVNSGQLNVVTDIAPVHSLVSMVVGEPNEVTLLIPTSQSPHTYNLKPSQRRLLESAGLIVILSQDFTPSLSRYLSTSKNQNAELSLAKAVESRSQLANGKAMQSGTSIYQTQNDPHAWLNPENAIEWIDKIAEAAIQADPTQAAQFEQNAIDAKQTLSDMHIALKQQLSSVQSEQYIVYHDAYRHFAESYSLQVPIAIALSDARAPGAATLKTIRAQAQQAKCVFSEAQHSESLVNMVVDGVGTNRATIDPLGSSLETGESLYPNLMNSLATKFANCLGG